MEQLLVKHNTKSNCSSKSKAIVVQYVGRKTCKTKETEKSEKKKSKKLKTKTLHTMNVYFVISSSTKNVDAFDCNFPKSSNPVLKHFRPNTIREYCSGKYIIKVDMATKKRRVVEQQFKGKIGENFLHCIEREINALHFCNKKQFDTTKTTCEYQIRLDDNVCGILQMQDDRPNVYFCKIYSTKKLGETELSKYKNILIIE